MKDILNSSDNTTVSFGYDNADRLTSRSYPNNVTTTYEYDGMSRLKQIKDESSTAVLFDRQYAYNTASQINQIAEPSQTRTFGYDNVDRLLSMTNGTANESYSFDDVGNRTASHRSASYGYQPNQFNRLISTTTANYNYDANGNMVTKAEGKEFWRFTWDYENRLTQASTRKQTVRYRYDALGRRVQRYIVGGRENTKFIYDGQDVLVDDNSGTLTKYLNGEGIDNKLRVQTGSDVKYFLADHLGSTNGLTDASGNLTEQTSYDSFGNATGNLTTRYQFTGREFDNFTGLHYYRARWYDSNLGRFISEDPIGFAGGDVNLYGYVGNNSLSFRDPTGKIIPIIAAGVVIGVIALILISPSNVNAPAPGDPIYYPDNQLFLNAAGGAVCGALFKRFVSPFLARILSGTGDDIIELGISRGGREIVEETVEGAFTSFDDVAGYVANKGKLPNNFITKEEAKVLGWDPKLGNLDKVAHGKSIGGDPFKNSEGLLPKADSRLWFEADINYSGGFRGGDRLLYSNDGLIFKTTDHYKTFIQIK